MRFKISCLLSQGWGHEEVEETVRSLQELLPCTCSLRLAQKSKVVFVVPWGTLGSTVRDLGSEMVDHKRNPLLSPHSFGLKLLQVVRKPSGSRNLTEVSDRR